MKYLYMLKLNKLGGLFMYEEKDAGAILAIVGTALILCIAIFGGKYLIIPARKQFFMWISAKNSNIISTKETS